MSRLPNSLTPLSRLVLPVLALATSLTPIGTSRLAAQPTVPRVITQPMAPFASVRDNRNLNQAWLARVDVDSRKDGFRSIQLVGTQLLAQTISGRVYALDAETGLPLWSSRFGIPYRSTYPLGIGPQFIFALQGAELYCLDRATGRLEWRYVLPDVPTAAAAADAESVFLGTTTGKLLVLELPRKPVRDETPVGSRQAPEAKRPETYLPPPPSQIVSTLHVSSPNQYLPQVSTRTSYPVQAKERFMYTPGVQPRLLWSFSFGERIEQPPLLTQHDVMLAGNRGSFMASSKLFYQQAYRFHADAAISAPIAQHGDTGYVVSSDLNLYAFNLAFGKLLWRIPGGAPVRTRPDVNDTDVYVVPEGIGLVRIERIHGDLVWRNRDAMRFLAANKKFVYALDREDHLIVIDYGRGVTLSRIDVRDWVVHVTNELTDRLYLASHDGQILCLHDKDYVKPLKMKNVAEANPAGAAAADAPAGKDNMKPQ